MLLTILAGLALAPQNVPDHCRDDDGQDRCAPAKQAEMRALYGVAPIETYAGASVRRIFFVDGYGNDTIAIEFVRAPEKDPLVRVHFPKQKGEAPIAPIEQLLTSEQWQQLIAASQNFDKQFATATSSKRAGKDKGGDQEIELCLHSWVYWAEAIDGGAKPRSTVNDACNDAPVEQFAWVAAKRAIGVFPFCSAIDPKLSRNDATRLLACAGLTGDRLAAAEVFNEAQAFRFVSRPKDGGLDGLTAYDFSLNFQGTKSQGRDAEAYWRSVMTETTAPDFFYESLNGLNADNVVVRAGLLKEVRDNQYQIADVEMRWKKDGGTFNITSMSVGPYRPHSFSIE